MCTPPCAKIISFASKPPEGAQAKFDKLVKSAFVFFRGTALIFYRDYAGMDAHLPQVFTIGDVHPENFGVMPNSNPRLFPMCLSTTWFAFRKPLPNGSTKISSCLRRIWSWTLLSFTGGYRVSFPSILGGKRPFSPQTSR